MRLYRLLKKKKKKTEMEVGSRKNSLRTRSSFGQAVGIFFFLASRLKSSVKFLGRKHISSRKLIDILHSDFICYFHC